jgi:hypothetical protein
MLSKLMEIQRREGLTDGQMATRLGISRPTWNLVRHGKRPFRDDWAVRAVGQWPELTRDLLDLAAGGAIVSGNADEDAVETLEAVS